MMQAISGARRRILVLALALLGACSSVPGGGDASPPRPEYPAPAAPPALAALGEKVKSGAFGNIHSLLVFRAGQPLAEFYFTGPDERRGAPLGTVAYDAGKLHDVRSITKSVTALAFGVALAQPQAGHGQGWQGGQAPASQGRVPSLEAPVVELFPEYRDLQTPERKQIKLRHLLSMTSGLEWDEGTLPYSDPRNSERMMDAASDPIRYVLEQKLVAEPGKTFRYSGGDVAVVAAILERAVGMKLDAYTDKVLFKPLGITRFEWIKDARGTPYAASGLRLRPRDLGKIAMLVADDGRYDDIQIVPAAWIKEATSPHAQVSGDSQCGVAYGYFWWLGTACSGSVRTHWIAGIGYGAQRVWIVPAQDTVIVSNAGLYTSPAQSDVATALFREALIATALSAAPPRPSP